MSKRAEQIAEIIQRKVNDFFVREIEFPLESLVTLTKIEVTPDLKQAVMYLSILPINQTGSVLKAVNKNLKQIRHFLGSQLKLRVAPHLKVVVDDSALKSRRIEKILEELQHDQIGPEGKPPE